MQTTTASEKTIFPTMISYLKTNYLNNLPTEIPTRTFQGAIATVSINLLAGSSSSIALTKGVLAATTSIVEAVTRPIIKAIFQGQPLIIEAAIQTLMPKIIVLGLASSLVPWVGVAYETTSVVTSLIACATWIALNNNFYIKDVAMAEVSF